MNHPADLISPEVERIVRDLGVPPCPAVLSDFSAEMRREEPDLMRISHLIGKDVAIAGALLKIVNSPLYALRHKAATVRQSLQMLGLRTTSNVVAGLLIRKAFPAVGSVDLTGFWDASTKIAQLSAYFARELGVANLDEAHTFALFRDCGVPVLMGRFPDYGRSIGVEAPHAASDVTLLERERYGVDHAEASAALARSWHMLPQVWSPIAVHHGVEAEARPQIAESAQRLIDVAMLAECAYRAHRCGVDPLTALAAKGDLLDRLGVAPGALDEDARVDVLRLLSGN